MIGLGRAFAALEERARSGRPLRVGLVGAGTFGRMVLSQARRLDGLEVVGVVDLDVGRARSALTDAGWESSLAHDDTTALFAKAPEVVVEATGSPEAAIAVAEACVAHGCHVVMVTVEIDPIAGPVLAQRARDAGLAYTHAYGDQPALICELVDWARASGLEVVCAGKGTKHLPEYHAITPDTVWEVYGLGADEVAAGGLNARMFTSFVDGTKSAVEMAAVCNATGLEPQDEGLRFAPCAAGRLAETCVPREAGGVLSRSGTVDVVSCLADDGSPIAGDLRWGVFVTFAAGSAQVGDWLHAYGVQTDASRRYGAFFRPYHFIGLETTVSVLAAGLLGEATGTPREFRADVVAVAKRDLPAGAELDGEGGYAVHGGLLPARRSLDEALLPAALAVDVRLAQPVAAGTVVRLADLEQPPRGRAWELRNEAAALA
jgi:predicted homoserine dehydrogenase-like protein